MRHVKRVCLAQRWHIRAQIVEPDFFRVAPVRTAPREKQHVGFHALRVENARRETEHRVKIALVHEVGADFLAVAVGKEDVVRQNHSGAGSSAGVQAPVDVLEEIQLLVAGGEREVVAGGAFAAFFCAEGGICEDKVIILHGFAQIGEGVAQENLSPDVVEHGIHKGKAVGVVDQFAAGERLVPLEFRRVRVQIEEILGMRFHIGMGGNHKSERPAGGVIAPLPRLRLHQAGHHVNEHTGREILSRAGLLFTGVLFQQSLVKVAQPLLFRGEPV